MGKRLFYFVDKLRAYDPKHNFYAELVFNPDDKGMIGNFFSAKSVEIDKVMYKLTILSNNNHSLVVLYTS